MSERKIWTLFSAKARRSAEEIAETIRDLRTELEDLRREAENVVNFENSPRDAQRQLADISYRVTQIRLKTPLRDYDGEDIPEGRELDSEALDLLIWLEEQFDKFVVHSDRRPVEAKRGAHDLYR